MDISDDDSELSVSSKIDLESVEICSPALTDIPTEVSPFVLEDDLGDLLGSQYRDSSSNKAINNITKSGEKATIGQHGDLTQMTGGVDFLTGDSVIAVNYEGSDEIVDFEQQIVELPDDFGSENENDSIDDRFSDSNEVNKNPLFDSHFTRKSNEINSNENKNDDNNMNAQEKQEDGNLNLKWETNRHLASEDEV